MIEIIQNSIVEFVFSFPTSWYESKSEEKGEGKNEGPKRLLDDPVASRLRGLPRERHESSVMSLENGPPCVQRKREREKFKRKKKKRKEKRRSDVKSD